MSPLIILEMLPPVVSILEYYMYFELKLFLILILLLPQIEVKKNRSTLLSCAPNVTCRARIFCGVECCRRFSFVTKTPRTERCPVIRVVRLSRGADVSCGSRFCLLRWRGSDSIGSVCEGVAREVDGRGARAKEQCQPPHEGLPSALITFVCAV